MKQYILRTLKVLFGLFLFAVGTYLTVQANIGLAPWEALAQGLSFVTKLSLGTMITLVGVSILLLDILLREKVGLGTILNTLMIGVFVNFLSWIDLVPQVQNFWVGIPVLLLGQVCICFGSYFYISPGMGCGPRDSLMVALGKRLTRIPIGVVRTGLEGVALVAGWLLGAKIGLGTVISVFGIGFILQAVFYILKFDVKAVQHESLLDTGKGLLALYTAWRDKKRYVEVSPRDGDE